MSEIKFCDNCDFLVHDSAKGDLCLACEKEQAAPLEASIESTDGKDMSMKSEKIDISPVEAERISDEEIDFAIKLGIDAPEHPRQVLAKICKQQQKDISELKAAIQPILSDYHEILNDKLDRQHIYQHDYDKKVALLTKLQARGR